MHEMAIAMQLVDQVVAVAEAHRVRSVEEVVVEAGAMRQIVPDALELAFSVVAEGTVAQGAQLRLIEVKSVARCRKCECEFAPELDNYVCPECGQADTRIVAGNDIILKTVTGSEDDGGRSS